MKKRIIPAIDLLQGQCVRLAQGDYATHKIYSADPVEMARRFEAMGFECLHLVDLDGAKGDRTCHMRLLEQICGATCLRVDYSGGLRSAKDIADALNAGAERVCVGSMAQQNVPLVRDWMSRFSPAQLMISADVQGGRICIHGWQTRTETTLEQLLEAYLPDLRYVVFTDIERDGMLAGAAVELCRALVRRYPSVSFIASGGVSSVADIQALLDAGAETVIVGKAFYENRLDINAL